MTTLDAIAARGAQRAPDRPAIVVPGRAGSPDAVMTYAELDRAASAFARSLHARGAAAGDRLILVTDGVTEAENARGDFFEDSRLEAVAAKSATLEDIFAAVANFCGGTPLSDDCTVVELVYSG